jgi:hypothetical protein
MSKERLKEKAENQYKAKVDKIFDKYTDEHGIIKMPIPEDVPPPADGDWWGPWRYNAKTLVLEYYDEDGKFGYEVDLERCNSSAEVLDWIFQLETKNWCGYEYLGQLVRALGDLLDPQANICSGGEDKSFDAGAYLRRKPKK